MCKENEIENEMKTTTHHPLKCFSNVCININNAIIQYKFTPSLPDSHFDIFAEEMSLDLNLQSRIFFYNSFKLLCCFFHLSKRSDVSFSHQLSVPHDLQLFTRTVRWTERQNPCHRGAVVDSSCMCLKDTSSCFIDHVGIFAVCLFLLLLFCHQTQHGNVRAVASDVLLLTH